MFGPSGGSSSLCGFTMPPEYKKQLEELKEALGEPPKDLEYGYMKD